MNQNLLGSIAMVAALLAAGCASDIPTQAADDVDGVVVAMVTTAVAHQSNGFAAVVEDAARIAAGESIAPAIPSDVVAAGEDASPVAMKPITFVRHGSRTDLHSEWEMSYAVRHLSSSLDVTAHSEGVVRTVNGRMQGNARGLFVLATEPLSISGSYEYNGSAMFTGRGEEQYPAVRIVCNWNRLLLTGPASNCRITGQMDVSISASGAQGTISKSGRLVFDGTNHAMLMIGGREYRVALRGRLSSAER